jgi:hypothetical protein
MKRYLLSGLRDELRRIEGVLQRLEQLERRSPRQSQRMRVLKRYRRGLRMILTRKSA